MPLSGPHTVIAGPRRRTEPELIGRRILSQ